MRASELLVRCLEAEGVEYIFGLPGEETLSLLDSLSRSSIKLVLTRHEQGAAFMANVYGRLTGRPGVCFATLGPGATNLLTGVADAYLDRSPLVAITGQASLDRVHKEAHQYIDVVEVFRPVTKWTARIEHPDTIPEAVRKAFKIAATERPGATHLELPEDVADKEAVGEPLAGAPVEYPYPSPEAVFQAAALLQRAESPLILVGNGVIRRRACRELKDLAHRLGVSVVNTFMGMGAMDYRDPLALSTVGLQQRDWAMCGLEKADVVLTVGYDQVEYEPRLWNGLRDKQIIHIDVTPAEVDEYYQPAVEVVSEIGAALKVLGEVCGAAPLRGAAPQTVLRQFIHGELEAYREDQGFPLKPQKILSDLRQALGEEDVLVCDVGAHKLWLARLFPAATTNPVVISNGLSAMGIGLPGAIAARLAYPQRRVVAVVGDGGFLMSLGELETARRLGLPLVILIWNDNGYGLIAWKEENRFGHSFGTSFTNPDFLALARAFGIPGFRVYSPEELLPTLRRALDMELPTLVEVPVDYSENLRLTKKLGQLVCPI